jgi:hypothetical protein
VRRVLRALSWLVAFGASTLLLALWWLTSPGAWPRLPPEAWKRLADAAGVRGGEGLADLELAVALAGSGFVAGAALLLARALLRSGTSRGTRP